MFSQNQEQEKPMTDRMKVYTKVLKTLKGQLRMFHQGYLVTLAMMITGIVMSRKAQLAVMSDEVPGEAKNQSIEMRMRRWVKHPGIDVEVTYMPFAQQILAGLADEPVVLAMDGSQIGRGCMVLMVGVVYRTRLLPLAWVVYKGKKGHTTAERHIEVLKKVLPLLPEETDVILLGDAEYDAPEMLSWVQTETTWQFAMRTAPNLLVQQGTEWRKIGSFTVTHGRLRMIHAVAFTKEAALPLNLVVWWGAEYDEPIFLVTNLPNASRTAWFYRRRFRIETFFSDQKSRGFHIHKSHLADPIRLSRLMIAACLAYIWMVGLGLLTLATGGHKLIDRTDRVDKSIFRLGLDWLRYVLKQDLPLQVSFFFQPAHLDVNVR
jgi:hypothetical protein